MTDLLIPWFTINQLGDVPSGPGLYAWYVVPVPGALDARTPESLASRLASHTRTLRHPTLDLQVSWHLGALWAGALPEEGMVGLATLIEDLASGAAAQPGKELSRTLHHAGHRQVLADVLLTVAPRLSAPLYIGVSKGLQGRLKDHWGDYRKARELLDQGLDPLETLASCLGVRLATARVPPEAIRLSVVEITSLDDLTDTELRRVAAAAEFVLNRWQHPLFGER